jgi:hypothetical protein
MLVRLRALIGLGFVVSLASGACAAKAAAIGTRVTICGSSITVPQVEPPPGSGPVVLMAVPCFESRTGGAASIPRDYQRYVELKPSRPLDGVWVPYDDNAQKAMEADYRRLWGTGKLDDLSITITDYTFANGVIGKFVTYTVHESK